MENKKPEKIAGWLLFFTIIFGVSTAKYLMSAVYMAVYPVFINNLDLPIPQLNPTVMIYSAIVSVILFIIYLITFINLLGKKALAKKLAITSVWLGFVSSIVSLSLSFAYLDQTLNSANLAQNLDVTKAVFIVQAAFSLLLGLAWAILVTIYFIKSKRVKNTLKN